MGVTPSATLTAGQTGSFSSVNGVAYTTTAPGGLYQVSPYQDTTPPVVGPDATNLFSFSVAGTQNSAGAITAAVSGMAQSATPSGLYRVLLNSVPVVLAVSSIVAKRDGSFNPTLPPGTTVYWDNISYVKVAGAASVSGCTDPAATNYNPAATVNDGSCVYPVPPPPPPPPPPPGGMTGPVGPTQPGVCVPLAWAGGPGYITGVGDVGASGTVMVCPQVTTPYTFTPAGGTPVTVLVVVTPLPILGDCPCDWVPDNLPGQCVWAADKLC